MKANWHYRPGLAPVLSLLAALACGGGLCAGLALLFGIDPAGLIEAVWTGAWGSPEAAAATVTKLTPLLLTGLAVALAYRGGLLNIGGEGQLMLGALVSASIPSGLGFLPGPLLLGLTIASGAAAGGLWAWPAVRLRQKHGVHEVITTLLLNYVAIHLCGYLVQGPLGDGTAMGRTPAIPLGAQIPVVLQTGSIALTPAPVVALLLAFGAWLWLSRTVWGFEARAVGANAEAARNAGIAVARWQTRIFVVSGMLAGLAGALEVTGVHHRFYRAFSPGYGFDGLTAAFLVNGSPEWLWASALFLASMRAADKYLQLALGVSPNIILVIQAVLLLAVACQKGVRSGAGAVLSAVFKRTEKSP